MRPSLGDRPVGKEVDTPKGTREGESTGRIADEVGISVSSSVAKESSEGTVHELDNSSATTKSVYIFSVTSSSLVSC